jgi:hypothetical protein
MYKMLGTTEIFPSLSLCPYDQVDEMENELPPVIETQPEDERDDNSSSGSEDDSECNSDNDSDEEEEDDDESPKELSPEEEEARLRKLEEEELHKEPSVTLLPVGWEEMLRQQEEAKELARQEAVAREEQRLKDEENGKVANEDATDQVQDESVEELKIGEEVLESKDNEEQEPTTKAVEIPVDRVRWMYENDEGWQLYNTFFVQRAGGSFSGWEN